MDASTSLADRIAARRPSAPAPEADEDAADDLGAFGCLRGSRDRALMIDFRLVGGGRVAFPYATLERVAYDPSEGVALRFLGAEVLLRGQNLAAGQGGGPALLEALHRHRAAWVRETEELASLLLAPGAAVVTRVEVREAR